MHFPRVDMVQDEEAQDRVHLARVDHDNPLRNVVLRPWLRRSVSCTRVPWTAAVWTLHWSEDLVTILRYYPRCKFIHFCRGLAEVGVGSLVSPSICRFSAE